MLGAFYVRKQQEGGPTCSDTIAKLVAKLLVLVFVGHCTIIARYVAKSGIAQMCLCTTKCQGGIAPFCGAAHLPEKVSRDTGYRSDSIAISRDMGPLSPQSHIANLLG